MKQAGKRSVLKTVCDSKAGSFLCPRAATDGSVGLIYYRSFAITFWVVLIGGILWQVLRLYDNFSYKAESLAYAYFSIACPLLLILLNGKRLPASMYRTGKDFLVGMVILYSGFLWVFIGHRLTEYMFNSPGVSPMVCLALLARAALYSLAAISFARMLLTVRSFYQRTR